MPLLALPDPDEVWARARLGLGKPAYTRATDALVAAGLARVERHRGTRRTLFTGEVLTPSGAARPIEVAKRELYTPRLLDYPLLARAEPWTPVFGPALPWRPLAEIFAAATG